MRSVTNSFLQLLNVPDSDGLRVCKFDSKDRRDTDLVGLDVGIGGDDGSCGEVDTLAHHVLSEHTLLLLQLLLDTVCVSFASRTLKRVAVTVHKTVNSILELSPSVLKVGVCPCTVPLVALLRTREFALDLSENVANVEDVLVECVLLRFRDLVVAGLCLRTESVWWDQNILHEEHLS